jgi:hypothetical protein
MDLNIITISYLFLRLAPFVLVCFFSLSSFLNQDFKGLVYLAGLIFACFVTIMFGNVLTFLPKYLPEERPEICNIISVNQQSEISKLPLGQTVFGFTFFYLLYPMLVNNLYMKNIPTLIFFPFLILFDIVWNTQNTCYTIWQLLASLSLGIGFGTFWAYLISKTYNPDLQYLASSSNSEVCSKPSKQTFQCKVYRNGELIKQYAP